MSASSQTDEELLDRVFGALSNRTRRQLLARLAEGPAPIGELAEPFAMSLPAVSRHVAVLERAGLVRRHVDGRVHRCTLDATPLQQARAFVERYRVFWEHNLDALAAWLEEEDP